MHPFLPGLPIRRRPHVCHCIIHYCISYLLDLTTLCRCAGPYGRMSRICVCHHHYSCASFKIYCFCISSWSVVEIRFFRSALCCAATTRWRDLLCQSSIVMLLRTPARPKMVLWGSGGTGERRDILQVDHHWRQSCTHLLVFNKRGVDANFEKKCMTAWRKSRTPL